MYPVQDDVFRLIPWAVCQEDEFSEGEDIMEKEVKQKHLQADDSIGSETNSIADLGNHCFKANQQTKDTTKVISLNHSGISPSSEPSRIAEVRSHGNPTTLSSSEHRAVHLFPQPCVPHVLEEDAPGTRSVSVNTGTRQKNNQVRDLTLQQTF